MTAPPRTRRTTRVLIAPFVALLLILTASPALAGFGTGGTLPGSNNGNTGDNTGGGSVDTGGGSNGGGTGGSGSGGGGGTGTVGSGGTTPSYDYWDNSRDIWAITSPGVPRGIGYGYSGVDGGASASYGGQCAPPNTTQWGNYIGVRVTDTGYVVTNSGLSEDGETTTSSSTSVQTNAGYSCYDPPHYNEYDITCPLYADATVRGVAPHSWGVLRNFNRVTSGWAQSGRSNPTYCQGDWPVYFDGGDRNEPWSDLGKYQLTAWGMVEDCVWRDYTTADRRTGQVPADVITCGAPRRVDFPPAHMQIVCSAPYVHFDWTNRGYTYTRADCDTPGEGGEWSCGPQIDQDPRVFGTPGGWSQVLADGKKRQASWATPVPEGGVRNVRNRQWRIEWDGGTPLREGVSFNDNTQPFVAGPEIEKWLNGWRGSSPSNSRSGFDLAFYQAGQPDKPWTTHPRWTFDADFRSTAVNITGINLNSGTLMTTTSRVWVPDSAQCIGQPMEADVYRARISNN